ncbi:ecdysteroid UDP-glucosyltransferase [Spodoptera litura nucleopolyhedrovirus]|uniref:Ecdysteroid UDP-glucosyltransferase n=2 Tax=Spodoptera litura multicapsid nucleopolyhedrovirus TaxID=46242 RepID=Q91BB3_NPVST|nr:ecdysteroid UDP-glucosyltransferase [Spodoptera litura nucleopolyhedrovirus]AAL01803.1 ecdysteroid UDP-glucosyltransferase [Spodoptera litura nucleopolyhedrovirus]QHN73969.1 egt [Spodoptera litura nucleopolyhedrovirus]
MRPRIRVVPHTTNMKMIILVVLLHALRNSAAVRVLCMFPTPSYSHQTVFNVYVNALLKRGHSLVVISPKIHNHSRHNHHHENLTEIDVGLVTNNFFKKLLQDSKVSRKRGIVSDASTVTRVNYMGLVRMISAQFEHEQVKRLLKSKRTFDVIIIEAFVSYPLILSYFFKNAPVILISSGHGVAENFETMGAVARHPVYYPNMWRDRFKDLSVWQTVRQVYTEIRLYREFSQLDADQNAMMKRQFGTKVPDVDVLRENVHMLFVNTHPMFDNNRPVPSNVQYLGGIHIDETTAYAEEIDDDLAEFLENSTMGVVYVSFGSSVRVSDMDSNMLDVFIETFRSIPYRVLWKVDKSDTIIDNLPSNVLIQRWFPQRRVLKHRNVKVFITQGGVQSTDEAIDAGVPMVGVPIMGDQFYNVNMYETHGIGRSVDTLTVDARLLIEIVMDVANNVKYKTETLSLRDAIMDQPIRPLEKAVWYTEHVARRKGAKKHLGTRAANVTYSKYAMFDLVLPILITIFSMYLQKL